MARRKKSSKSSKSPKTSSSSVSPPGNGARLSSGSSKSTDSSNRDKSPSAKDKGLPAFLPSERVSKNARNETKGPPFVTPRHTPAEMKKDLDAFGFAADEVTEMISRKDADWDPAMPGYIYDGVAKAQVLREKRERGAKKDVLKADKETYEPLCLNPDRPNWVLFDANKGFGSTGSDPPAFVEALATFKPNNKRVLEYNIESDSVRVRSTPPMLQGKEVEYTDLGPKIVDSILIPEKKGDGRPSKHPLSNVIVGDDEVVETSVAADQVGKHTDAEFPAKTTTPKLPGKTSTPKLPSKTSADEATTNEQVEDTITVQHPRRQSRKSSLSADADVKQETEEGDVLADPADTTTAVDKADEPEEDTMVKRLRGRKRKSSEIAKQAADDAAMKRAPAAKSARKDSVIGATGVHDDDEVKVKRPRGRPRKHPRPTSETAPGVAAEEGVATRRMSKDSSAAGKIVEQNEEPRGKKRKSSESDEGTSMSANSIDEASGGTNKDHGVGEQGVGQDGEPQGKKRKVVKAEPE